MKSRRLLLMTCFGVLMSLALPSSSRALARAQEHPADTAQKSQDDRGIGSELAQKEREAEGEEEEHQDLKHSTLVKKFAKESKAAPLQKQEALRAMVRTSARGEDGIWSVGSPSWA